MSILIKIHDITCYGYHGLLPEEQLLGQKFRVTLELSLDNLSPEKDLISETLDYRDAVEAVRQIMEGPPQRLLETLAREIAEALLAMAGVKEVKVSVSKPHPPIPAVEGGVTVVITGRQNS